MRNSFLRLFLKPLCIALACLLIIACRPAGAGAHAKNKGHHWIHLRWNAPAVSGQPVAGYNIYRSSDSGTSFQKMNKTPVANPEYDDKAVQSGTIYLYVVKSVTAKGVESKPSNQIQLAVPGNSLSKQ